MQCSDGSVAVVYMDRARGLPMEKSEKIIVAAMALAAAFVFRKQLWKWLSSEPSPEYVPDSVAAELFMESNHEAYPDFEMQWDDCCEKFT